MITTIILIALTVNGLMINPAYQWLLEKLNLLRKPFNCMYCLSFWIGVIVGGVTLNPLAVLIVPLSASFLTVWIGRAIDALPFTIK